MSEICPDHDRLSLLQCNADPKCRDASVKINWDVDILFDENCGGTDWLFSDDSFALNLRYFDNGNIYIDSKNNNGHFDYRLTPQGRLLRRKHDTWVATAKAPEAIVTTFWGSDAVSINRDFYECYLDGDHELSAADTEVVKRFFMAVELLFYNVWECTSENEDGRYPSGCE